MSRGWYLKRSLRKGGRPQRVYEACGTFYGLAAGFGIVASGWLKENLVCPRDYSKLNVNGSTLLSGLLRRL